MSVRMTEPTVGGMTTTPRFDRLGKLSYRLRQRYDGVRTMSRVRWAGVLAAVVQLVYSYADHPPGVRTAALVLTVSFAVGSALLVLAVAHRRHPDPATVGRLAIASLALDFVAVMGFVTLYAFGTGSSIWALLYILPLEGALIYQRRGALIMMISAAIVYGAGEMIGAIMLDHPLPAASLAFRLGIGFFIAAVAGAATSRLALERDRAWKRERQLEALLNHSRDVIAVIDADATLAYVSPAIQEILGYEPEEMVGRSGLDFVHAEDREKVLPELAQLGAEPGGTVDVFYRCVHRDGRTVWFQTKGINALEDAAIQGILLNIHDITMSKAADEELARINRQLSTLLSNLPGIAYRCKDDEDWTAEFVSEGSYDLLGYTAEELTSGTVDMNDLIHPDDRGRMRQEIQRASSIGAPFQIEYRIVTRDGTEKWVWEQGRMVSRSGDDAFLEGLIIDATERKRLEGHLAHSQKMDAIGRLAGGIAHDFNNLLAVVTSYASIMIDDVPPDSQLREDLEEIYGAGMRGAELVRQLLSFSRHDVVDPRILDGDEVIAEMMNLLIRAVGEHIEISASLRARSPVRIDRAQLEQVLMNLVVNARDAMPRGGHLKIETYETMAPMKADEAGSGHERSWVAFSVEDNGEGMDPGIMGRIFDPFFTTKATGTGTGLGLATAYGIVQRAGGWIDVRSELGSGTRFDVFLPPAEAEATPEPAAASPDRTVPATARTILVVEDEDPVRRVVERILKRAGHEVLTAASAAEALERLDRSSVDLIITDVVMPGLSGHAMVEELRRRGEQPNVIYMSGYDQGLVSQQGTIGERDVLIRKPFTETELLSAVQERLTIEPR